MVTRRLDGLKIPLALAGAATLLFYVGLFLAQPLLSAVILLMPENYEYLARRFFDRGEFDRAIQACQREIAGQRYNFHAAYLLAEMLHRSDRKSEALDLLRELPERYRAILARHVPSRGWNEAHLHLLLAKVLWDLGRLEESLDQLQVAFDCHDPKVDSQCADFVATISNSTDARIASWGYVARVILDFKTLLEGFPKPIATGQLQTPPNFYTRLAQIAANRQNLPLAQSLDSQEILKYPRKLPSLLAHYSFAGQPNWPAPIDLVKLYSYLEQLTVGRFTFNKQMGSKVYLADWYWAHLLKTTVTTGTAVLSGKSRGICVVAKGTVCDNVWPILSIHFNGKIVGQRYICSPFYQAYTLPLELQPGVHTVGVGFENDASNPISKRDRNLEIHEIRFY
jgi:tetratricopeptide (TPR) repeat protein